MDSKEDESNDKIFSNDARLAADMGGILFSSDGTP